MNLSEVLKEIEDKIYNNEETLIKYLFPAYYKKIDFIKVVNFNSNRVSIVLKNMNSSEVEEWVAISRFLEALDFVDNWNKLALQGESYVI